MGAGLVLLVIGGILLMKQFGFYFPGWIFTWPMILVVVGIFIGAKHNFNDFGWIFITGLGIVFLLDDIYPEYPIRNFAWPALIIGLGLFMIIANRSGGKMFCGHRRRLQYKQGHEEDPDTIPLESLKDDFIDLVAIFGAVKKQVISKNFRGGDIVSIFGGAEVNLTQADITGPVVLDLVQIFGGAKLVIPGNWEVRTEAVAIFGGVEDKRRDVGAGDPGKVLIIKGATIFGGIELTSYK